MPDVPSGGQTPPSPLNQQTNTNKNLIIAGVVIVLVLLGGWLVFGRSDTAEDSAFESDTSEEARDATLPDTETEPVTEIAPLDEIVQGEVKEFAVEGVNFKFNPSELRVQQGDTVRITLTNGGTMPHDWRVDEFAAATAIVQPGQEDTVEFVADQAGTFEYYCSVGQHRQQGMVGKLIVK